MMYLDHKTTQIWWLAKHGIQTLEVVVVLLMLSMLSFDVFTSKSSHPLLFWTSGLS